MWLIYATTASMLWGLSYTLYEQVYRYTSIYTAIAVNTFVISLIFFFLSWYKGVWREDATAIMTSPKVLTLFTASIIVFALAELFIALSITAKNATLAGLIEISYPLFIALFTFLLFREVALNAGIALGGAVIFVGVAIVFWFSN